MSSTFFFVLLIVSALGSTFQLGDRIFDLPTPQLAIGPQDFQVNGTTIIPTPSHACSPISEDLTGLIALVDSDKCAPYVKAKNSIDAGAVAVVIRGYRDTFGLLFFYRSSGQKNVSVPVVELWGGLKPDESPGGNESVVLGPAPSPIAEFGEGAWTFYTIILSLYILVTAGLAGRKLYEFRKTGGYDILPSMTMGLILITCFIRIPIIIDPTGMRGIYNWGTIEAFLTIDFSFAIVSALVVAFHWDALVKRIEKEDESHKRLKIIGFIISILLIIIEITTSVMRGLYLAAMPFLLGKVILYCFIGVPTGGYFLWSGRKIIKKAGGNKAKISKSIKRRAYYGLVIAIFLILFPITALLVATPMYDPPGGYFMLRFMASFWLNNVTLFLVLIFEMKKSDKNVGDKRGWVSTAATKTSMEEEEEMNEEE